MTVMPSVPRMLSRSSRSERTGQSGSHQQSSPGREPHHKIIVSSRSTGYQYRQEPSPRGVADRRDAGREIYTSKNGNRHEIEIDDDNDQQQSYDSALEESDELSSAAASESWQEELEAEDDGDDDEEEYTIADEEDNESEASSGEDSYVGGADLVDKSILKLISPFKDHDTLDPMDEGNDEDDDDDDIYCGDSVATENRKAYKLCVKLGSNDYRLTEMDIDCSSVEKKMAKEIAELLPQNNRLQRIRLAAPNSESMSIFRVLASGLARNSSITDVQIRNTDFDREAAGWLGSALARNQSVEKLCLRNCKFFDSGLPVLFLGMQHSTKIRELYILQCDLSEGVDADVVAASIPLMKLTSLCLIDTRLGVNSLRFIFNNIAKTPSLTQLNLSINKKLAMPAGIKALVSTLQSSRLKLTTLSLSSCSLDASCISKLARSLVDNATITSINLSGNRFGVEGASYLKRLLEKNNSIKELQVNGCNIDKKREKAIADGLRYNNSLLKSIFSKGTSLAIFDAVEKIEKFGADAASVARG